MASSVRQYRYRRKLLLTSSQVSVMVTSGILLLFTSALFLSGCAIQRRTLRELRIAIRPSPKPSPKIYLPDRFRETTTELEDGRIVIVSPGNDPDGYNRKPVVPQYIEIKETMPDNADSGEEVGDKEIGDAEEPQVEVVAPEEHAGDEAATARDINIKNQIEKTQPNPDPLAKDQSPLSRAERRRLIKEELKRLSHIEGSTAYQRRLW